MCPACIATVALVAGATSTGGTYRASRVEAAREDHVKNMDPTGRTGGAR
jgi:hypothetical protein